MTDEERRLKARRLELELELELEPEDARGDPVR